MASLSLYDLTIPIVTRGLTNLKEWLKKGEAFCDEKGLPHSKLLEASIHPDMKPMTFQITIACDTAKFFLSRLGGQEHVPMEDNEKTLPEFYERIDKTLALLEKADASKFVAPDSKVAWKNGPHEYTFVAINYVQRFAIPNFFFHLVTAYDILRAMGVGLGKKDYLDFTTLFA